MTSALQLECWLDPALQPYLHPGIVNWHAALVDPYTKALTAVPAGGSITFQWTQPPVQTVPQTVTPVTTDQAGAYHVSLPITTTMYGRLILTCTVRDGSSVIVAQNTLEAVVVASGQ